MSSGSPSPRENGGGIFLGVGAALAILVLLVLQTAGSGGLFGTMTETVTVPSISDQVSGIYANHLSLFSSKNVSAIVSQYEDNATIQYEGVDNGMGLAGNYTGTAHIHQLIFVLEGRSIFYFIANESQPTIQVVTTSSGNPFASVVVNSTFGFGGESSVIGNFNGTISARTMFVRGGPNDTSWLISEETWNFLGYWVQYPIST